MIALTHSFGLRREPFAQEIAIEELFPIPGLKAFGDRCFPCAFVSSLPNICPQYVG